jgi:hypothetical protein
MTDSRLSFSAYNVSSGFEGSVVLEVNEYGVRNPSPSNTHYVTYLKDSNATIESYQLTSHKISSTLLLVCLPSVH